MSSEWGAIKLADISCRVDYGYTASADPSAKGPLFLRITDILGGSVDWTTVPRCEIDSPELARYQLQAGDIVVARTGASSGENYRLRSPRDVVFASYLVRFRLNPERADSAFVAYVLRSPFWWKHVRDCIGGSAQPQLNAKVMSNFELRLPLLDEQRRVAGVLGALDDKIEHNTVVGKRVRKLADLRFREVFLNGKVRIRRPLGEVASIHNTSKAPVERPNELFEHFSIPAFDDGSTPLLERGAQILSAKTSLPDHDVILFSKLNPATPRVWWPRPSGAGTAVCSSEFVVLVPAAAPVSFLYASLRNDPVLYDEILGHVTGTTGSRQRVKPTDLLGCSMIAATNAELESYEAFARPLYDLDAALQRESQHLGAIRDSLLPKLIAGAIRVPESYDPDGALGTVADTFRIAVP